MNSETVLCFPFLVSVPFRLSFYQIRRKKKATTDYERRAARFDSRRGRGKKVALDTATFRPRWDKLTRMRRRYWELLISRLSLCDGPAIATWLESCFQTYAASESTSLQFTLTGWYIISVYKINLHDLNPHRHGFLASWQSWRHHLLLTFHNESITHFINIPTPSDNSWH